MTNPSDFVKCGPDCICKKKEHEIHGRPLHPPFPENCEIILLGMGCFWGAERALWEKEGVYTTAVGFAGGHVENPTYPQVRTHSTGHTEVVLVVYDPKVISTEELIGFFFEVHDPTQGDRQHGDIGNNYRSAIYCYNDEQMDVANRLSSAYSKSLADAGKGGTITTEIKRDIPFWYAEDYHQQYLEVNKDGYCGLKGIGVSCPRTCKTG